MRTPIMVRVLVNVAAEWRRLEDDPEREQDERNLWNWVEPETP